jgi:hypothetical protein
VTRSCIFCNSSGPFTKEHVLAEWIARLVKLQRVTVTATKTGQPDKVWQSVGSFGAKVGPVCKACNSGWMSDLETLAAPALTRLIRPRKPTSISFDEQVVIASWLWKLAIVHEKPSGAVYFNADERTRLMNGDAPPEGGVHMWVSCYDGRNDGAIRGGPANFTSPMGHSVAGFLMTVRIRRFAAQLLCVRELPGHDIDVVGQYDFTDAERLLWPEGHRVVSWPPQYRLDDSLFEKWHARWNTPGKS